MSLGPVTPKSSQTITAFRPGGLRFPTLCVSPPFVALLYCLGEDFINENTEGFILENCSFLFFERIETSDYNNIRNNYKVFKPVGVNL
ncbi:rCG62056, isoform CRA_b [Rattus norvegicus]|uniref:RCG62056, isoform CRA_b n=1 Tax=Rattus norvegicus TaxID=10116 RepID=A6H9V0_RAT|nr:rCG62056, isoform CRA_b [Rattus norvegicus]